MILTLHGVRDMHDPCFCLCGPESPAATYGIAWENFNLKTVASHTCREGEPETARWWKSQPWTEQGPSVHVRCPNHFCGSCTAGKGACALFLCRDQQLLQEGAVVLQVLHTSRLVMHTAPTQHCNCPCGHNTQACGQQLAPRTSTKHLKAQSALPDLAGCKPPSKVRRTRSEGKEKGTRCETALRCRPAFRLC